MTRSESAVCLTEMPLQDIEGSRAKACNSIHH